MQSAGLELESKCVREDDTGLVAQWGSLYTLPSCGEPPCRGGTCACAGCGPSDRGRFGAWERRTLVNVCCLDSRGGDFQKGVAWEKAAMLALRIEDHASIGLSGPGSAGRQSFYGFIILVVDGAPVSCGTFCSWVQCSLT